MPDESWSTFTSRGLPYRIRVPQGWEPQEPSESQKDEYWGEENLLTVEITTNLPDLTPGEWFSLCESNLKSMGFRLTSSEPLAISGIEARLIRAQIKGFLKKEINLLRAPFFDGTFAWEATLTVGDGSVEPDRSLFIDILSGFERMDVLLAADDTSGNVWALQPGDCFVSLPLQFAPEGLTVFIGGVDGFSRVACSEPHTGEVAEVLRNLEMGNMAAADEVFEAYVGEPLSKSDFGMLIMEPLPEENVPSGVQGLVVIAHRAGLQSGSVRGSGL